MRNFLKTKGLKMTSQRETIFRAFFESEPHMTVEELHERVVEMDPAIAYTTVWRTLKLICDVGLGEKKYFGDGVVRYDRVTSTPHGHLVCQKCGSTEEFFSSEITRLLQDKADESGLLPEEFRIEIIGICLKCRQEGGVEKDADNQGAENPANSASAKIVDISGAGGM